MRFIFTFAAVAYLLIYAFEGAVRYGLYSMGMDDAILLRDGLVIGPVLLLLVVQAFRIRVHPAFGVFAFIVALHGGIAALNLHTALPAIYGAKLLVTVLFGFFVGRELTQPSRLVLGIFVLVWVASVVGIALDKFVYTFPWTGLETHVGGIKVDVSRGWDIDGGFEKRVAGFSRSSISAAMLVPTIAMVIAPRIRNWPVRAVVLALSVAAAAFTTQKGALAAAGAVAVILLGPAYLRFGLLRLACMGFILIDILLPFVTAGLMMPQNGGVFSFASFAMRIMRTWPDAWQWIGSNDVFPFGVGLGGIGGAQRFYAANFFNPSDNMFVFLYANFGVASIVYLAWIGALGRGLPEELRPAAIAPLAALAFNLGYGAALSMLEDQVSALFLGAAAGMLWQLHQQARAGLWSDPYAGARMRLQSPVAAHYYPGGGRAVKAR